MNSTDGVTRFALVRGWHFVVLAWLLAYVTRPFILGFYDDDWLTLLLPTQTSAAFSWGRFSFLMNVYANRPGTGIMGYVVSSLCSDSPVLWHAAISFMVLATALALRAFLRSLLRLCGRDYYWAADLCVGLWLVFPWALGSLARPVSALNVNAVTFFALSGALLFDRWRNGKAIGVAPYLLFLASCLTYEALFGQFVVLFVIAWVCGVHRQLGLGKFLIPGVWFAVIQLLVVGWNRLVPLFNDSAPSKSFCPIWFGVLLDNLDRLRYFMGHSVRELSPAFELLLAGIFTLCCGVLVWKLFQKDERTLSLRSLGVLGACGLGLFIGLVILSLAGYPIRGVGMGARTTMSYSVWLAIALTTAIGSLPRKPIIARTICTTAALVLGSLMVRATQARLAEWGQAWDIEQEILADAPLEDLAEAHPDAVVLFMGPEMHKGVGVFGYMRNLDLAMEYTYPELKSLHFCCAARDHWVTSWDGRHFEQRLSKYEPWTRWKVWNQLETPEVWVWVRGSGCARRVAAPFTFHGKTNNENADEPVFRVELPFVFSSIADERSTDRVSRHHSRAARLAFDEP